MILNFSKGEIKVESVKSILENYYWDEKNNEWKSIFWFLEKNMERQESGREWIKTNFSDFRHKRKHLDLYLKNGYYEDES